MLLHTIMANVLAAAPPPAVPREGGSGWTILLFQVVMIGAIFYFLLIRPQRKERQRHQEMLSQLAKGDRVMTSGGIIGQIVHASETELTIRTAENTRLVVDRGHIARKVAN